MKLLIKNAKVILPNQICNNYGVSIIDGKIVKIDQSINFVEDGFDKIINADGNFLSPGFIDIHNHGNSGYDAMDSTIESLIEMSKFHIKNGVVGFLATTMTQSSQNIDKAINNIAKYIEMQGKMDPQLKAQVLGVYLEGPYFSQVKKGAQPAEFIKRPNIEEIKKYIYKLNNNLRIVALAPEIEGVLELIAFLKLKGITVSAGHTNATYDETITAIDKGASQATHLYNGMRAFSHREPSVIGAVLTDDRVNCEMICDGIHLHPAAMKMAMTMKGKQRIILISDAMMATGLEDGEYLLGGQKVFVRNGVARLADGTLAGSTLTINKAVYNIVNLVGVSLEDAVYMASYTPAEVIGISDKKGSIEIGKDADLIIFDKKIDIKTVIINGNYIMWYK